jgi:seryl-tRNA synthetase
LENSTLDKPEILTLNENVFRYEGRFNWNDFGRLRDYHVREIVFFGDIDFVELSKKEIEEMAQKLLEELDMNGRTCITYDQFIIPSMQKYKIIQVQEQSKHELQLEYDDGKFLAAASFNHHGTAFTDPFDIKIKGCDVPVSGCIGFGIERWVLAFLSQYGFDTDKWPEAIRTSLG